MQKKTLLGLMVGTGLLVTSQVFAGEITGHIQYSDGSDCSGCRVAASISSGGVTKAVYTDSDGDFTLVWSSNHWIDKLFVKGKTVMHNIKPGKHVNIRLD